MASLDIGTVIDTLAKEAQVWDVPVVELIQIQTNDPFRVLIATILSARTKDGTTAKVCKKLFTKVKKVKDFDKYTQDEIAEFIYPVGFYKTKAKHLKQLPQAMQELFDGKIPEEIDDLVKLPGVGRKTANLVRAVAFDKPAICVDTHVHRISNRLGYIKTNTPFDSEMALRKKLPIDYWKKINWVFVAFGQNHCKPIGPKCDSCPVYSHCKRVGVKN